MVRALDRRRHPYNTARNKKKIVRTPGQKHVYHWLKKKPGMVKCGDCKRKLQGLKLYRNRSFPATNRKVKRCYGGTLCNRCVRTRIIRAFLIEEQKIVVKVLKSQQKQPKVK